MRLITTITIIHDVTAQEKKKLLNLSREGREKYQHTLSRVKPEAIKKMNELMNSCEVNHRLVLK